MYVMVKILYSYKRMQTTSIWIEYILGYVEDESLLYSDM